MRVSGLTNIPGAPGNLEFFNTQRMQPRLPTAFGGSGTEPQVANAFTDWLFGKKSLSDIVAPGVDRTLKGIPDPTRINGSPGIRDTRNKQQQIIDQLRKGQSFVPEENTFLAQAYPGGQNIGNVGGMLGEVPGDMTGFTSLLESLQEQNMQNSQGEKDRRSLVNYGRNLGNY